MADGLIQVPPDSTGKKVDAASLDVGAATVYRQRIVIGDNSASAQFATVTGGALVVSVSNNVNISAMPAVTGLVGLTAGTAVIGDINAISRTVQVAIGTPFTINNISAAVVLAAGTANIGAVSNAAGTALMGAVSLAAGTANIGFLNNISATVVVAGVVSIAAGSALIGDINAISRTVQVAIGTPFTVNNISAAVVLAAGTANIGAVSNAAGTALMGAVSLAAGTANIGFINNISATVNVAFAGGISLAAGTANIGTINNVSATVVTGLSYVIEKTTNSQVQVGDSANAAVRVNIVAGAASGVSQIDGTSFTSQAANFVPIGGIFDDAATDTLSENDAGVVRMTTNRAFHVNIRDAAGAELGAASATGIFVRTATVTLAAGAANIGTVNGISATISVILAAGTANFGTLNNISATIAAVLAAGTANIGAVSNAAGTALMGAVSLAAGTANVGSINNISATVIVAGVVSIGAGTALMGAVSLAAGTANIGSINNISATVNTVVGAGTSLIGSVSLGAGTALVGAVSLAAGTANIGFLNNISATVNVVLANTPIMGVPSASHGPATVTVSTSAVVVLVANPGNALSVYVTQLVITNAGTVSTLARIGTSATPSTVLCFVASAGGGAVIDFNPPWKMSASATAIASVKPNSSGNVYMLVNYYVAA